MPNVYFRAKSLWEHGDTAGGFAMLAEHLEAALGCSVFLEPDFLVEAPTPGSFETAVQIFLTATMPMSAETILQAPFSRVLAEIWELDPSLDWLSLLREYDFFAEPSQGILDIEELAPPPNDLDDFEALAGSLEASAGAGLLSATFEGLNAGRPSLTTDEIDEVPEQRWGPLKPLLRQRLAAAYANAPDDPWPGLVDRDAQGVLERFLHHLFGRRASPVEAAEVTWGIVAGRHPRYAWAARTSLDTVLDNADDPLLAQLVQIDAGRLDVRDGRAWLVALREGLDSGTFGALGRASSGPAL